MNDGNYHQGQPVYQYGAALDQARAAVVMLHGRGASAQDILGLAEALDLAEVAYLAPQAYANTWYPYRFLEPTERNQPWLSSALSQIEAILAHLLENEFSSEKVVLLGFSQGACLALEYAVRNPRRYGGLAGLSGGLIGSGQEIHAHSGTLVGTPVFLGCDQQDFHIPQLRVEETASILKEMHADVTLRLYSHLGHAVNDEELDFVRQLVSGAAAQPNMQKE